MRAAGLRCMRQACGVRWAPRLPTPSRVLSLPCPLPSSPHCAAPQSSRTAFGPRTNRRRWVGWVGCGGQGHSTARRATGQEAACCQPACAATPCKPLSTPPPHAPTRACRPCSGRRKTLTSAATRATGRSGWRPASARSCPPPSATSRCRVRLQGAWAAPRRQAQRWREQTARRACLFLPLHHHVRPAPPCAGLPQAGCCSRAAAAASCKRWSCPRPELFTRSRCFTVGWLACTCASCTDAGGCACEGLHSSSSPAPPRPAQLFKQNVAQEAVATAVEVLFGGRQEQVAAVMGAGESPVGRPWPGGRGCGRWRSGCWIGLPGVDACSTCHPPNLFRPAPRAVRALPAMQQKVAWAEKWVHG